DSTELSEGFQSAVVWAHHICGPPFFVFNAFVCLLILFDTDPRGKSYRKYLLSLQLFSISADILMSGYSPIIQFNCRLMYAESELAKFYNMEIAIV
ncbi:hypothetical protein PMAYCL1PPCAC_05797, partial [Pristionchus mayeri]